MSNRKAAGLQWQRLREDAGLEQLDAAEQLEISRVSLSRYENGRAPIPKHIERAMQALYQPATGVSAAPTPPATPPVVPVPRAQGNRHFRALHEKASAEQKILLAQLMLDTLAANILDLQEMLALPEHVQKERRDDAAKREASRQRGLAAIADSMRHEATAQQPVQKRKRSP